VLIAERLHQSVPSMLNSLGSNKLDGWLLSAMSKWVLSKLQASTNAYLLDDVAY
jgi:hypothetical protein